MTLNYYQGNVFAKQETATTGATETLVTPPAATSFSEATLDTALTGSAETSIVINETPPAYLGTVGSIKVIADDGTMFDLDYTNLSSKTFTVAETDFSSSNASTGAKVLLGIENRVVLTGWSFSAINTGSATTAKLHTSAATPMDVLIGRLHATTGTYQSDSSGMHLPLPAGESLQVTSGTGVTSEVTVCGYFVPATTPVLAGGYVYGTP